MLIHSPWRRILRRRDSFRIEDQSGVILIVSRHVSGWDFPFPFRHKKWRKNSDSRIIKLGSALSFLSSISSWKRRVGAKSFIIERAFRPLPLCFRSKKDSYLQDDSWAKGKEKGGRGVEGERFLSNPSPLFFTLSRRVATHLTSGNGHLLRSAYYFPDPIDRRGVFQPENYAIKQARIVREPRQRLLLATTMRTRNNRVWQSGARRCCSRNYLSHRKIKQQFLV